MEFLSLVQKYYKDSSVKNTTLNLRLHFTVFNRTLPALINKNFAKQIDEYFTDKIHIQSKQLVTWITESFPRNNLDRISLIRSKLSCRTWVCTISGPFTKLLNIYDAALLLKAVIDRFHHRFNHRYLTWF